MLLEKLHVVESGVEILFGVRFCNLGSFPEPQLVLCLNQEVEAWVQSFASSLAEQGLQQETCHNSLWIFNRVRTDQEYSWIFSDRFKAGLEKSLIPLVELRDESHVRIGTGSAASDQRVPIVVTHPLHEDQVSNANSGRSRDALDTVDKHSTTFSLGLHHEVHCIVKDASNVFLGVVAKVVTLVGHSFVFVVLFRVGSGAVDYVRDLVA